MRLRARPNNYCQGHANSRHLKPNFAGHRRLLLSRPQVRMVRGQVIRSMRQRKSITRRHTSTNARAIDYYSTHSRPCCHQGGRGSTRYFRGAVRRSTVLRSTVDATRAATTGRALCVECIRRRRGGSKASPRHAPCLRLSTVRGAK